MQEISNAIFEGAMAFLNRQYKTLIPFVIVIFVIIGGIILLTKGGSNGKGVFYNPDKNIKIAKSKANQI